MAPLPDNSTARVWLSYQTGGGTTTQNHEMLIRYNSASGTTSTQALQVIGLALSAMGAAAFFDGWQATSARAAAQGSDVSLPIALPAPLTTLVGAGQATATIQEQAREVRFLGRSPSTGRRVSLSIYGMAGLFFADADFRVLRTTENLVGEFLDAIEDTVAQAPVAIDNAVPNWYPYANWQYNSYWERTLRA